MLQALSFQPTGAICAAATTSLPEVVGGARNWDYRYAWVRDASFTIEALWVAACPDEANEFFDSMTAFAAGSLEQAGDLQIMFGIGGERDLTERELPHLRGWRLRARAGRQRGVAPAPARRLRRAAERGASARRPALRPGGAPGGPRPTAGDGPPPALAPSTRRFLVELADTAARRWQEKDHGIWEVRGEPRHFVYSKLMCWVALDRATALADRLGAADRVGAGRRPATRSVRPS